MKKQSKKATQTPTTKPIVTQTGKIPDSVGFSFSKNFTKAALPMLLLTLATSCDSNSVDEQLRKYAQAAPQNKVIVLQTVDFSRSTDQIVYFDSSAANNLFHTVASSNGGTIKFIGVLENSSRQNVLSMQVDHLDTNSATGEKNMYKIARIRAQNKKKLLAFDEKMQGQISQYIKATVKPHTEPFTDLTNALALAGTTLNQPIYATGYNKYLLLCSDCINDPRAKRHAKLVPVNLPHTTVLVVRSALSQETLNELFPMSKVYLFTDINDAIAMIK